MQKSAYMDKTQGRIEKDWECARNYLNELEILEVSRSKRVCALLGSTDRDWKLRVRKVRVLPQDCRHTMSHMQL
jgi:hypothetical protein